MKTLPRTMGYDAAAIALWAHLKEQAVGGPTRILDGRLGQEWKGTLKSAIHDLWPSISAADQRRAESQIRTYLGESLVCVKPGRNNVLSVWWVAEEWGVQAKSEADAERPEPAAPKFDLSPVPIEPEAAEIDPDQDVFSPMQLAGPSSTVEIKLGDAGSVFIGIEVNLFELDSRAMLLVGALRNAVRQYREE